MKRVVKRRFSVLKVPRSMQTRCTEISDIPVLLQKRQTVQVPSLVLAVRYCMSEQYMTQQDMRVRLHMKRTAMIPLPPVVAPSCMQTRCTGASGIPALWPRSTTAQKHSQGREMPQFIPRYTLELGTHVLVQRNQDVSKILRVKGGLKSI